MYWAALPGITALALSTFLLGLPAYRAFVREEEAWAQAGFALYFFFVPIVIVLFVVAVVAGGLCLATHEVRHAPQAISITTSAGFLLTGAGLTFLFGLLA